MSDGVDIFISYARADRARVDTLWEQLSAQHWNVWRDDNIPNSVPWEREILGKLESARCVLVAWSPVAVRSEWVRREASAALERGSLMQAIVEDCSVPDEFGRLQIEDLRGWQGEIAHAGFSKLLRDCAGRIGPKKPVGTLPMPAPHELVSDKHLAIVHSAWRKPEKDADFGERMYQIHVILVGQQSVLDRVDSVIYYLDPSYPTPTQVATERSANFGIYQLANGYSMMRASVKIRGQKEIVELSRFINLHREGPRLKPQFIDPDPKWRWHDEA